MCNKEFKRSGEEWREDKGERWICTERREDVEEEEKKEVEEEIDGEGGDEGGDEGEEEGRREGEEGKMKIRRGEMSEYPALHRMEHRGCHSIPSGEE